MAIFNRKKKQDKEFKKFEAELTKLLMANTLIKALFEHNIEQLENDEEEMVDKRVMIGALQLAVGHLEQVENTLSRNDD